MVGFPKPAGGGVPAPPPLLALNMPENTPERPETARSMRRIFARYSLSFPLFFTKIWCLRRFPYALVPLCFQCDGMGIEQIGEAVFLRLRLRDGVLGMKSPGAALTARRRWSNRVC